MKHAVAFSAPHHRAADVGMHILKNGGSAIEAMIAAAATISVVYPHMNSIAGDGFWLIHEPNCAPRAIDAAGFSAASATQDFYAGLEAIPARGARACVTMGGTVAGWQTARTLDAQMAKRQARLPLPLASLLQPAKHLAETGISVTQSLRHACLKVADALAEQSEFKRIFMPNGQAPQVGDTLINQDLAKSFTCLIERGLDDFYRGQLAAQLAAGLAAAGSPLALADFHEYQAQVVEPLSVSTSKGTFYNLPAPTQGLASLLIVAIYDQLVSDNHTEEAKVHLLIEATKQAFLIRDQLLQDPARMTQNLADYLTPTAITQMAEAVAVQALPWPKVAEPGDTVWMGCVDQYGVMVSFIQSVYWEFGAGVVIPGTGIVWNNRGVSFSLRPDVRNSLLPRIKPFHTLNPAFAALHDGRRLCYGTMGGEGQPQTQAAFIARYLYDQTSMHAAIAKGRWLLGRTWGDIENDLKIEEDLADRIAPGLRMRGHKLRTVPSFSEIMGHAGAVMSSPLQSDFGVKIADAATDPRSDGAALIAY